MDLLPETIQLFAGKKVGTIIDGLRYDINCNDAFREASDKGHIKEINISLFEIIKEIP